MILLNEESNKELYYDINKALQFLRTLPKITTVGNVKFFAYWKNLRPFGRKQALPILSFLTTQDQSRTKFILYSNVDLSDNIWLRPLLPLIEFKVYDVVNEAKNTPLENKRELFKETDDYCWADTDLFRLLMLYKYGGVYIDMDVVLLRRFDPILDQEYMYKWGREKNMINGAVMALFKESKLATMLLEEIKLPRENNVSWDTELYVKVKKKIDFTVFPSAFFNPEWQVTLVSNKRRNDLRNPFKRTPVSSELFDGVFSWHWHNKWDEVIENGSKFEILEKLNKEKFQRIYGFEYNVIED